LYVVRVDARQYAFRFIEMMLRRVLIACSTRTALLRCGRRLLRSCLRCRRSLRIDEDRQARNGEAGQRDRQLAGDIRHFLMSSVFM
jgi:hypothetical protein